VSSVATAAVPAADLRILARRTRDMMRPIVIMPAELMPFMA
jgi:hypothetical protein